MTVLHSSIHILMESSGIFLSTGFQWIPMESVESVMDSIGIHWNLWDSSGFLWIPMEYVMPKLHWVRVRVRLEVG
jgi:hypothetical protein